MELSAVAMGSAGTAAQKMTAYNDSLEASQKRVTAEFEKMTMSLGMQGNLKLFNEGLAFAIRNITTLTFLISSLLIMMNAKAFGSGLMGIATNIAGKLASFSMLSSSIKAGGGLFGAGTRGNFKSSINESYYDSKMKMFANNLDLVNLKLKNTGVVLTEYQLLKTKEAQATLMSMTATTGHTVVEKTATAIKLLGSKVDEKQILIDTQAAVTRNILTDEEAMAIITLRTTRGMAAPTIKNLGQNAKMGSSGMMAMGSGAAQMGGMLLGGAGYGAIASKLTKGNETAGLIGNIGGSIVGGWALGVGAAALKAGAIGTAAGGPGVGVVVAAGAAVAGAIGGIVVFFKKKIKDAAAKAQVEEVAKVQTEYTNAIGTQTQVTRYDELVKGVDNLGKNVALTTDEYQEFLKINNELSTTFPSLEKNIDSQGNSIITVQGRVQGLTSSIQDMIEAMRIASVEQIFKSKDGVSVFSGELDTYSENQKKRKEELGALEYQKHLLTNIYTKRNSYSDPNAKENIIRDHSTEVITTLEKDIPGIALSQMNKTNKELNNYMKDRKKELEEFSIVVAEPGTGFSTRELQYIAPKPNPGEDVPKNKTQEKYLAKLQKEIKALYEIMEKDRQEFNKKFSIPFLENSWDFKVLDENAKQLRYKLAGLIDPAQFGKGEKGQKAYEDYLGGLITNTGDMSVDQELKLKAYFSMDKTKLTSEQYKKIQDEFVQTLIDILGADGFDEKDQAIIKQIGFKVEIKDGKVVPQNPTGTGPAMPSSSKGEGGEPPVNFVADEGSPGSTTSLDNLKNKGYGKKWDVNQTEVLNKTPLSELDAIFKALDNNIDATSITYEDFQKILSDNKAKNPPDISGTLTNLDTLQTKLLSVGTIYDNFKKKGKLTAKDQSELLDTFKDTEGIEAFKTAIASGGITVGSLGNHLKTLVGNYIKTNGALENVTDATRGLVEEKLREFGVMNAGEIVQRRLNEEKIESLSTSDKLIDKTYTGTLAFFKEGLGAQYAGDMISYAQVKAKLMNSTEIDTLHGQNAFLNLAKAAGITGAAIDGVIKKKIVGEKLWKMQQENPNITDFQVFFDRLSDQEKKDWQMDLSTAEIKMPKAPKIKLSGLGGGDKTGGSEPKDTTKDQLDAIRKNKALIDKEYEASLVYDAKTGKNKKESEYYSKMNNAVWSEGIELVNVRATLEARATSEKWTQLDKTRELAEVDKEIIDQKKEAAHLDDVKLEDDLKLAQARGESLTTQIAIQEALVKTADTEEERIERQKVLNDMLKEDYALRVSIREHGRSLNDQGLKSATYGSEEYNRLQKENYDSFGADKTEAHNEAEKRRATLRGQGKTEEEIAKDSEIRGFQTAWIAGDTGEKDTFKKSIDDRLEYSNKWIENERAHGRLRVEDEISANDRILQGLKEFNAITIEDAKYKAEKIEEYEHKQIENSKKLYDEGIGHIQQKISELELVKPEEWTDIAQIKEFSTEMKKFYQEIIDEATERLRTAKDLSEQEIIDLTNTINDNIKKQHQAKIQEQQDIVTLNDKVYSALVDKVNEYIEAINDEKEAISKRYDDEITRLQKVNEEKERSITLSKLQEDLANSAKEKKRVYRAGIGWVYETDKIAVNTAQKALDDFKSQDRINDLQKAKDAELKVLDDKIDGWNKYLKANEKEYKAFEKQERDNLLFQLWGADTQAGLYDKINLDKEHFLVEYKAGNKKYIGAMSDFYDECTIELDKLQALKEREIELQKPKIKDDDDSNDTQVANPMVTGGASNGEPSNQNKGTNKGTTAVPSKPASKPTAKPAAAPPSGSSQDNKLASISYFSSHANGIDDGAVSYTGLSMLHGTPTEPEYVLNNGQAWQLLKNFATLQLPGFESNSQKKGDTICEFNGDIILPNVSKPEEFWDGLMDATSNRFNITKKK